MNIYAFSYCTFEKLTPKPYVYKLTEAEIFDLQIDTRNIYEPQIIVVDEEI